MSAQFHTPSFGDEEFDLSDCGADLSNIGGIGSNQIGSGAGVGVGNGIYMQQDNQETRRVRGMDHHHHELNGGDSQGSVLPDDMFDHCVDSVATQHHLQQQQGTNFIVCNANMSGGGMTASMPTTLAARKQMSAPQPNTINTIANASNNNNNNNNNVTATTAIADPNEPAKPLSPYALFFRETMSAIKQENPQCSFQELSRIVASMWETLDDDDKNVYNRKNEIARNDYIKQMRLYRQQQQQELQTKPAVFTISNSRSNAIPTDGVNMYNNYAPAGTLHTTTSTTGQPLQQHYPQQHVSPQQGQQQYVNVEAPAQQQMLSNTNNTQQHQHVGNNAMLTKMPQQSSSIMATSSDSQNSPGKAMQSTTAAPNDPNSLQQIQMITEAGSVQKCTRENCNKRAIINPDWEDEYCSNECVVQHCSNVFNAWVKSNLEARKQ